MKSTPSPYTWTFSTLGCPENKLAETVALAKAHGLQDLELRAIDDRVDLPALFREQYGSPDVLKAYLADEGITIRSLDTSLKLSGNKPEEREAFLEFLPWADALGVPYLRVFDGGTMVERLSPEELAEVKFTIDWWREEKRKSGWKADIMIETHDCLTRSSAIQQLQESLDEPVAILWDTHHTWKKGGEDPTITWSVIKEWVPHVHIKDSISKPSARHPFTYVQLGAGEFDLPGTLDLFRGDGFSGVISIEWERKWHPYMPPLEEALQQARSLGWW